MSQHGAFPRLHQRPYDETHFHTSFYVSHLFNTLVVHLGINHYQQYSMLLVRKFVSVCVFMSRSSARSNG